MYYRVRVHCVRDGVFSVQRICVQADSPPAARIAARRVARERGFGVLAVEAASVVRDPSGYEVMEANEIPTLFDTMGGVH